MARKKTKALPPKMITVYGEILQETELAILVRCDDEADGVWLPKSRIKYNGERGDTDVEIEIPKLLADEKGFFDGMGGPEVETSPTSVETPVKRVFGDNVKWLKEERITVSAPLTEAEKARYADEMAALDGEIEALKDERAEVSNRLKKAIDAKEEERLALSRAVNEGEMREVLCDCLKDYNTEEIVWTEAWPPYAEVLRRKMTKEEKRPSLLEFKEKNGQTLHPAGAGEDEDMDFDAMTDQPDEAAATLAPAENNAPAAPETAPTEAA